MKFHEARYAPCLLAFIAALNIIILVLSSLSFTMHIFLLFFGNNSFIFRDIVLNTPKAPHASRKTKTGFCPYNC
jgi:hypothetical protein